MKQFISRLFYFSILVLGILFLLQAIISYKIKGTTTTGYDNLEQTANVNADLIFLGSSRCLQHFDPVFFDSCFKLKSLNLGISGHSEISMATVRLKDYLSRNNPPKFAILNFDPFVKAGGNDCDSNVVFKNYFARYAFLPNKKDILIVNYFKFNLAEKYIPLYAIFKYRMLGKYIGIKNENLIKDGYEKHEEHWDTIANPVSNKMKVSFFKLSDTPSITKALYELNVLCLQNDIKLICIQTPVYKILQDDTLFAATASICKSLNIPFIDANNNDIKNDIHNFPNSNHLNIDGIMQLNAFLKKDTLLSSFLKNSPFNKVQLK